MSEETNNIFTPEEILEQAQLNVRALVLIPATYLKSKGLSLDEYYEFMGRRFALTWEGEYNASDIIRTIALGVASGGGKIVSISGDETQAEGTFIGASSAEEIEFYDLTQAEADKRNNLFGPIANYLGYDHKWQRHGDQVTVTVSRRDND